MDTGRPSGHRTHRWHEPGGARVGSRAGASPCACTCGHLPVRLLHCPLHDLQRCVATSGTTDALAGHLRPLANTVDPSPQAQHSRTAQLTAQLTARVSTTSTFITGISHACRPCTRPSPPIATEPASLPPPSQQEGPAQLSWPQPARSQCHWHAQNALWGSVPEQAWQVACHR